MNEQDPLSRTNFRQKWISRRKLIREAAGAAAGAGFVAGSGLWTPARAEDDEDKERCALPLPIPHISVAPPPAPAHFFFPGPVDGLAAPTDPHGPEPNGRDPSTITNFEGFVGQVDLTFSGMGMDTETGTTSPYDFHTDTRFMKGVFIGSDERRHHGAFAFI